jgi:hypothetical protein
MKPEVGRVGKPGLWLGGVYGFGEPGIAALNHERVLFAGVVPTGTGRGADHERHERHENGVEGSEFGGK